MLSIQRPPNTAGIDISRPYAALAEDGTGESRPLSLAQLAITVPYGLFTHDQLVTTALRWVHCWLYASIHTIHMGFRLFRYRHPPEIVLCGPITASAETRGITPCRALRRLDLMGSGKQEGRIDHVHAIRSPARLAGRSTASHRYGNNGLSGRNRRERRGPALL